MAWTALTYAFGSLLTSTKMTQLFDNLTALANGDSGAPAIVQAAIAAAAIGRTELKTSIVGEVSTGGSSSLLTLPGGEYGFYPQIKISTVAGTQNAQLVDSKSIGTSYVSHINLGTNAGTISAQQRYMQSSPPYMVGNRKWDHFLYILRRLSDGIGVSSYSAEDPPYAYNGPPHIEKDHPDRIAAVPHPFIDYWFKDPSVDGLEIILIDLSTMNIKKWINDNRVIGKSLLEDIKTILPGKGIVKPLANYALPLIPGFTDKVKIVIP